MLSSALRVDQAEACPLSTDGPADGLLVQPKEASWLREAAARRLSQVEARRLSQVEARRLSQVEARRLSQVEARRIFLTAALPFKNHVRTHGIA